MENEGEVKINFWDMGGDPVYFEVRNEFYLDTHGVFLTFDVSNRISFENLKVWMKELKQFSNSSPPIIICGNKCDNIRTVSREEGEIEAQEFGAKYAFTYFRYYETSAVDGSGIQEMFLELFKEALEFSKSSEK